MKNKENEKQFSNFPFKKVFEVGFSVSILLEKITEGDLLFALFAVIMAIFAVTREKKKDK